MSALTKLRPDRCAYLRGFDGFGASAAMHSASASGFTVSGTFRDAADFAVAVLYDIDCFFEHPRIKYLPDPDLSGVVLSFDLTYSNLHPIDSPKFPTIDWPYLDVIRMDGTTAQIALFAHAVQSGGIYTKASGTFTIATAGAAAAAFDRVTLWFENAAFDFIAAGGETASHVASALAAQINGYAGGTFSLAASAADEQITVNVSPPGADGNTVTMYSLAKNAHLTATPAVKFAGGSSAATWTVTLDFTALGIDSVRQMWLTLAPALADGAYAASNWDAVFANWTVTSSNSNLPLRVAGTGSVRMEETDAWCKLKGSGWAPTANGGFYSQGFASATAHVGDSAAFAYSCQHPHDLWMGTALYTDRGIVSYTVDGGAVQTLNMYLNALEPIVTRRQLAAGLTAGQHTIVLTLTTGIWYLDFLEAVVRGDPPPAAQVFKDRSPAIDFDTDSTYKIPPARLMSMFDLMGWQGPMNEYIGVFWWNQRTNPTAVFPSASIAFGGAFAAGDSIFIDLGGTTVGKTVFPADTLATIAAHFAYFLNETSTGVWAAASGATLTLTARSPAPAYQFTLTATTTSVAGTLKATGVLTGGSLGKWVIDLAQTPPVNYGVALWHADLFAQVALRGLSVVTAFSFELVNPPAGFAAEFPDGTAVETATGFSSLVSTQCAPGPALLSYQIPAYIQIAQLQQAAGLTPEVQFGEFLWWFFTGGTAPNAGMGYYDAATAAAAAIALGRPLHRFLTANDDPSVNGFADATFLASRLAAHVASISAAVTAAVPGTLFELLYPYDVNYPTYVGLYNLGGQLNAYVNFPAQWQNHATSGLDRIKMEALDFGSADRNLNWAQQAMSFPFKYGWPKSACRYLVPVFNGGCPWVYEQTFALAVVPCINYWAYDHVCLFGWDVSLKAVTSAQIG